MASPQRRMAPARGPVKGPLQVCWRRISGRSAPRWARPLLAAHAVLMPCWRDGGRVCWRLGIDGAGDGFAMARPLPPRHRRASAGGAHARVIARHPAPPLACPLSVLDAWQPAMPPMDWHRRARASRSARRHASCRRRQWSVCVIARAGTGAGAGSAVLTGTPDGRPGVLACDAPRCLGLRRALVSWLATRCGAVSATAWRSATEPGRTD